MRFVIWIETLIALTSSLMVADYVELDGLITKLTWLLRKLRARPPLEGA